ncbi:MAG: LemA family protein [Spirochaetales bacterium]|uniref:LemA family protein n=1 Tax=Bullifex sp. TaxID=2815808 RepID=UPI002A5309D7|nr:LemA family protein [Bullifex sp.]MDD5973080.1 LemA family protein [Spirochaetales bacterium]MDD7270898.1 LemA family protein [Spirochaetales bacterium]MDY4066706.1 LemA family protein [Bullifex sp.]
MTALIIILVIAALVVIYFISTYNSFVKLRNQAEEANAGIDVHLKQRYDLIPNLVETVKGYAKHESSTLEAVIKARNSAMSATTMEERDNANNVLSGTLKSLFALSESYPELKANSNFLDLQQKLSEIEKGLLNARKYYNAIAKQMNSKVEMFPSNLVASMTGFKKLSYAEVEEAAKQRVEVKF